MILPRASTHTHLRPYLSAFGISMSDPVSRCDHLATPRPFQHNSSQRSCAETKTDTHTTCVANSNVPHLISDRYLHLPKTQTQTVDSSRQKTATDNFILQRTHSSINIVVIIIAGLSSRVVSASDCGLRGPRFQSHR